jgi:hypothetical protein
MRTEALRSHCERLCREHEIQWRVWPKMGGGLAVPRAVAREIETTPVKGPVSYATLSREIGQCCGTPPGSIWGLVCLCQQTLHSP